MTRKSGLTYLNIAHFLDHFFLLIFPTAVIAIEGDWELTYGQALPLGTSMYVAFALATPLAGWLGDHFSRHHLITVFFLGCGAASVLAGLASGSEGLVASLALLGVFASIYHPVGMAMVIELAERPGRSLAVNGVYGNLGLAGAALITGLLAERFGWRIAFILPGLVSIAIGCMYSWHRGHREVESRVSRDSRHEHLIRSNPTQRITVFAIVLISAVFGGAVFNTVTVTLPKLFDERLLHVSSNLSEVGGYVALVFAIAAFAQLPVGHLLDRFGARPILIGLLVPQILSLYFIATAYGAIVIPIAMVLLILMFAEIPITSWLIGHYVPPSWRARAFSVEYVLSLGMGAAIVPLIAWGHRKGFDFQAQYLLLAVSAGVVFAAAWFLPARSHYAIYQSARMSEQNKIPKSPNF